MERMPAVVGTFYPKEPDDLIEIIEECFRDDLYGPGSLPSVEQSGLRHIFGLICPHAGYPFSGFAAAKAFHRLAEDGKPDSIILIGPNHRAIGPSAAIYSRGSWFSPLGEVRIDEELSAELLTNSRFLQSSAIAHEAEHSLEVQLPFLQYLYKSDFKIVPIVLSSLDRGLIEDLGGALAKVVEERNAIIIASSDLSHYLSQSEAEAKDSAAIEAILTLDTKELYRVVFDRAITMCGVAAVASLLTAARLTGGMTAHLLGYNTSGDVIGDKRQVVGYAGMEIVREA